MVLVGLLFYSAAIVAASLAGGLAPQWLKLNHTRLQMLLSGVAGLMLGVALLHLLPHGHVFSGGSIDWSAGWLLIGLLATFFMIRVFHVHQHVTFEPEGQAHTGQAHGHGGEANAGAAGNLGPILHSEPSNPVSPPQAPHKHDAHQHGPDCDHGHDHDHHHHHHHGHHHHEEPIRGWGWVGLAIGLALHTIIDGMALGAASVNGIWESVAVFLAILLHKPVDAMAISTTMSAGGWDVRSRWIANIIFSLMCPLGALFFFIGVRGTGNMEAVIVGTALLFSAGVFLCIALADLLPEISFHSHDRWPLSLALAAGVLAAYAIGLFEPGHLHTDHDHSHDHGGQVAPSKTSTHEHDHGDEHSHGDHSHGEPSH
jgi:zinc and cadmium transporter